MPIVQSELKPPQQDFPSIGRWTELDERRQSAAFAAREVQDESALEKWIAREVRELIPHRCAVVGIGNALIHPWTLERSLSVGLSDDFFADSLRADGSTRCPLITRWLEADATQVIDAHDIVSPHLFAWRERAMRFGVRVAMLRGYGLGLSGQFVFLKLFDPAIALGDAAKRLEEIMPSVLVAWRQVLQNEQKSRAENKMRTPRIQFTPKEVELLAFIKTGKSNSEIAQILGKSETKVKTQVGTMLRKAGVPNRVALATSGH